jgi:hypothetical protein
MDLTFRNNGEQYGSNFPAAEETGVMDRAMQHVSVADEQVSLKDRMMKDQEDEIHRLQTDIKFRGEQLDSLKNALHQKEQENTDYAAANDALREENVRLIDQFENERMHEEVSIRSRFIWCWVLGIRHWEWVCFHVNVLELIDCSFHSVAMVERYGKGFFPFVMKSKKKKKMPMHD